MALGNSIPLLKIKEKIVITYPTSDQFRHHRVEKYEVHVKRFPSCKTEDFSSIRAEFSIWIFKAVRLYSIGHTRYHVCSV